MFITIFIITVIIQQNLLTLEVHNRYNVLWTLEAFFMFSARWSNISSPWVNILQRKYSKLQLPLRTEGVPCKEHVLLIIKINHGERSYVGVGLKIKCASFLVLSEFKQNPNLSTIKSQIWNLKKKLVRRQSQWYRQKEAERTDVRKPSVAFGIRFAKVPNCDSTYYSQRLTFIKKLKINCQLPNSVALFLLKQISVKH